MIRKTEFKLVNAMTGEYEASITKTNNCLRPGRSGVISISDEALRCAVIAGDLMKLPYNTKGSKLDKAFYWHRETNTVVYAEEDSNSIRMKSCVLLSCKQYKILRNKTVCFRTTKGKGSIDFRGYPSEGRHTLIVINEGKLENAVVYCYRMMHGLDANSNKELQVHHIFDISDNRLDRTIVLDKEIHLKLHEKLDKASHMMISVVNNLGELRALLRLYNSKEYFEEFRIYYEQVLMLLNGLI